MMDPTPERIIADVLQAGLEQAVDVARAERLGRAQVTRERDRYRAALRDVSALRNGEARPEVAKRIAIRALFSES